MIRPVGLDFRVWVSLAGILALAVTILTSAPVLAGQTTRVEGIVPRGEDGGVGIVSVAGDRIYFVGTGGYPAPGPWNGLWVSDGTTAGTSILDATIGGAHYADLDGLTVFTASKRDAYSGDSELWRSDGTPAGTHVLKDIYPGDCLIDFGDRYGSDWHWVGCSSNPGAKVLYHDDLYFPATNAGGRGLWKTDGTAAGTELVRDALRATDPVRFKGQLYFAGRGRDPASHGGIWKSDGTTAGTRLVKEIRSGADAVLPRNLVKVNGRLFFEGYTPRHGWRLWVSDGTPRGTKPISSIEIRGNYDLVPAGRFVYFVGYEARRGSELWRSNGTRAGTRRVRDINPGAKGSNPFWLTPVWGRLYFSAYERRRGRELWVTDGTARGTRRVRDIRRGFRGSSPKELANVAGTLYFSANGGNRGREVWKSDGTARTTVRVADAWPGEKGSKPRDIVGLGGSVMFIGGDFDYHYALWRYDP